MSCNSKNEIIVQPAEMTLKMPASLKRYKSQKVNGLAVPVVELICKRDVDRSRRRVIHNSNDSYAVFQTHWDMDKIELVKQFKVILLTNSNHVLGIYEVSSGRMNEICVDPKFVFSAALLSGAGRVIFGSNHTGSLLHPSASELLLTKRLIQAGNLLDIEVLDHIILSADGYFSFAANGMLKIDDLLK